MLAMARRSVPEMGARTALKEAGEVHQAHTGLVMALFLQGDANACEKGVAAILSGHGAYIYYRQNIDHQPGALLVCSQCSTRQHVREYPNQQRITQLSCEPSSAVVLRGNCLLSSCVVRLNSVTRSIIRNRRSTSKSLLPTHTTIEAGGHAEVVAARQAATRTMRQAARWRVRRPRSRYSYWMDDDSGPWNNADCRRPFP